MFNNDDVMSCRVCTLILASEGLRVVGLLLEFGVVGLLLVGVVDLFERDPVRKSGNLYGETVLFSAILLNE